MLGTLLFVLGSFFLIRATRNPDLTQIEGWMKWFSAPLVLTSEWPERAVAILAAVAITLGLAAMVALGWTSWWVRSRPIKPTTHSLEIDAHLLGVELARTSISERQAFVFWQALREPTARYPRISETVEMGTRSFRVSTAVAVNTADLNGEKHAIPVALFNRGRLENGLTFTLSSRTSSLSHIQAAAYATAVVERLVRSAGAGAARQFQLERDGDRSLHARVVDVLTCTQAHGLPEADEIARAIAMIPCRSRRRVVLYAAATVVTILAKQYPVCVWIGADQSSNSARVTMERVVIPSLRHYNRKVRGVRKWVVLWLKRIVDLQKSAFGVPANTVDFSTNMASRAGSYHLNVRGPDGAYLAHQELRDGSRSGLTLGALRLKELSYAMNARRGQRTGHLYAREGAGFRDLLYSCTFYERMPGSMATAFVGAITTTLIAVAVAYVVLFTNGGGDPSGLLQILLAFPLALTATSSFRSGASFWGGDLAARWATAVTLAVLTLSLLVSTVGTAYPRDAQVAFWSLILVVSSTNALLCFVSWMSRATTYHSFLGR